MKKWLTVLAALILIALAWDNRVTLALYTLPFFLNSEEPDFAAAERKPAALKLSYKTYENAVVPSASQMKGMVLS